MKELKRTFIVEIKYPECDTMGNAEDYLQELIEGDLVGDDIGRWCVNVKEVVSNDENRIYSLYLEFSTGQHGWADFEKNKLSRERIFYLERPIMQYLDSVMANSFLNCECKYKVFKSDEIVREGGFVFKSK